jgi:apolipoprotein N-acyltransferase
MAIAIYVMVLCMFVPLTFWIGIMINGDLVRVVLVGIMLGHCYAAFYIIYALLNFLPEDNEFESLLNKQNELRQLRVMAEYSMELQFRK